MLRALAPRKQRSRQRGIPESFAVLRRAYDAEGSHTDRFMSLAAIGDLGTPEALDYLRTVQAAPGADSDEIRAILELYLGDPPAAPAPALATR